VRHSQLHVATLNLKPLDFFASEIPASL
jgi:hypothetical protein